LAIKGYKIQDPSTNIAINEFNLCKTFGWTLDELYRQSMKRVAYFSEIIGEEIKIQKAKEQDAKADNMRNNYRRK